MIRSPIEWKFPTISVALLAAALAVPLALWAPAPAEARQKGTTYAKSGHDGDPYRLYRRRGESPQYGRKDRKRDDRRDHDDAKYRKRDDRKPQYGRDDRRGGDGRKYRKIDDRKPQYVHKDRKRDDGKIRKRTDASPQFVDKDRKRDDRKFRKRDEKQPQYARKDPGRDDRRGRDGRTYRKRDDRKPQYRRNDQRRSYRRYSYPPDRSYRHAYRTPSHRHDLHGGHRRLSESYIRGLALWHYPTILGIEYWDGIYYVRAHDYYGRTFRLAYDAYTGIFLTFVFLGILGHLG